MPVSNTPFIRMKLDEEERADVITVRLNQEERAILEEFKKKIKQNKDSTAFKLGFLTGANVIHTNFSGLIGVRLFKKQSRKVAKLANVGPVL